MTERPRAGRRPDRRGATPAAFSAGGESCAAGLCVLGGAQAVQCAAPGICQTRALLTLLKREPDRRLALDVVREAGGGPCLGALVALGAVEVAEAAGGGFEIRLTDRGGVL